MIKPRITPPPRSKNVAKSLAIRPALFAAARLVAAKEGMSLSKFVGRSIRRYLRLSKSPDLEITHPQPTREIPTITEKPRITPRPPSKKVAKSIAIDRSLFAAARLFAAKEGVSFSRYVRHSVQSYMRLPRFSGSEITQPQPTLEKMMRVSVSLRRDLLAAALEAAAKEERNFSRWVCGVIRRDLDADRAAVAPRPPLLAA